MPESRSVCRDWAEDLSALIDGELGAPRAAEVRAHVAGCEACARSLDELRGADLALAQLAAPQVADDLHARLQARLAASPSPARVRSALPRRRRTSTGWRFAAGLAAAAAVALAVLFGLPRNVGEPGVPIAEQAPPAPALAPSAETVPLQVAEEPALDIRESASAVVEPAPPPSAETPPAQVAESLVPAQPGLAPDAAPGTLPDEPPGTALTPEVEVQRFAELDALPEEDIALLLEFDAVAELDLLDNLDLLEALVDLDAKEGA